MHFNRGEMEEIKCPLCDIYSNDIVINENGYTGKKCDKCKMIFISPRPDEDKIISLYKENISHISAESHISGSSVKRIYARHNLSLIKRYINKGSILEIGAGGGYFLDEAKKAGFEVSGIELNGKQAQFINNKLKIDCETIPLNEASFKKEKKFDCIYHCDVMSHFYDPIDVFNMINFKLKDKGFVVFETGNLGDMDYPYYKYISCFQYPDHLFFFSESSIGMLLERTGFDLIKIYRYSIIPQLLLSKIIACTTNAISSPFKKTDLKKDINISRDANKNDFRPPNLGLKLKRWAITVYEYLFYYVRYYIGSIYFKSRRPQTIIVIAQKRQI